LLEGTVDSTPGTGEVVASLLGRGAEVILITGDLTVSLAIDAVVAEASKGGVPVISTQPEMVARGALIALGGDYYQIGRDTGDLAARVLGGEDMNRMPVIYSTPTKLAVNRNAAAKLKSAWVFPSDVLAKAAEANGKAASATANGNAKPIEQVSPPAK
jgi:putative ABC transport system substrate-binding protein